MVVALESNPFTQDTGSLRAFAQGLFTQDKFLQDRFAEPRSRTAQSASAHPEPPESRCQSQFARGMGYTAFGTSHAPRTTVEIEQRYTYTGRETTTDPNLMYYRWRMYAPTLGRFTARDPIGYRGGIGLYAYVSNSTYRYSDPYGLSAVDCCDDCKKGETKNCRIANYSIEPFSVSPQLAKAADDLAEATDTVASVAGALNAAKGALNTGLSQGAKQAAAEAAAEKAAEKGKEQVGKMPDAKGFTKAGKGLQGKAHGYTMTLVFTWDICKQEKCTKPKDKGKNAWTWSGKGTLNKECRNGFTHVSGEAYKTKADAQAAFNECVNIQTKKVCNKDGSKK
jgi:RHS repeat-associated protein